MARRRMPRRGQCLPPHDALPLAQVLSPGLHATLLGDGFTLTPTVRPYLRTDGHVSIRLVWRCRHRGDSASVSITHVVTVDGRSGP